MNSDGVFQTMNEVTSAIGELRLDVDWLKFHTNLPPVGTAEDLAEAIRQENRQLAEPEPFVRMAVGGPKPPNQQIIIGGHQFRVASCLEPEYVVGKVQAAYEKAVQSRIDAATAPLHLRIADLERQLDGKSEEVNALQKQLAEARKPASASGEPFAKVCLAGIEMCGYEFSCKNPTQCGGIVNSAVFAREQLAADKWELENERVVRLQDFGLWFRED